MSDYGIKTGKRGVSALEAVGADILMTTKYPFAKIDPTKAESFRTTTVVFLNDTPDNVKTQIAFFAHGYTYKPEVWGLWNVTWGPSVIGTPGLVQNGYGALVNSSGTPSSTLSYGWDETNVYLYMTKGATPPVFPSSVLGTTATLTTYIFVDDLQTQTY